ncbi:hypothetical protein [Verrucomicrobium sp. BvORR106]|uniref:hypothetical protein n=1 Tax=Verrucomicrobium sp. BvORR106 TaxID=1403819 RepID=UPI00056FB9DA|nr:hypothetical protein [Verrucomicrobium sp. BvORR106]
MHTFGSSSKSRHRRGAAMMFALAMVMVGTIAVTGMMYVLGARLQQAERMASASQRRLAWMNTDAANRQYGYVYSFRDTVTRAASSASLATNWGGLQASAYSNLSAYETTQRPSAPVVSYPFNNIQVPPTEDEGYFYERTVADSNSNQAEHVSMFNYLKSYPALLQGDLLVLHKKAASATGDYYITNNIRVDGRVVIYDGTAQTTDLRANSYIHMKPTFTNTVKNNAGTATQLPENYAITPTATAGYGGTSTPTAVTNGTLKMINNTDFTPGSIYHLGQTTGSWSTYSSTTASGSTTTAVQIVQENSPTYAPPTTSPYNTTYSGKFKVLKIRLKNTGLTHCRITGAYDQVVIEGQTTATEYSTADTLSPIIVWLDPTSTVRDVRFVGENNRRFILAAGPGTGTGAGTTLFLGYQSSSIVSGGPLRWRTNLITEYRPVYINLPTSVNLQMTGGIRTDWVLNCTDTGTGVRIILQRETDPENLEKLLPRDAWMETYFLVR